MNETGTKNTIRTGETTSSMARSGTTGRVLGQKDKVLFLLAETVKIITASQIAREFMSHRKQPTKAANKMLSELETAGLVSVYRGSFGVIERPASPLATSDGTMWQELDLASLAWKLSKRGQETRKEATTYATITAKGCAELGGKVPRVRAGQIVHDILVTDIALGALDRGVWVREDFLCHHGFDGLLPDALILPNTVIEIGGASYTKERLEQLFEAFEEFHFELW